MLRFEGNKIHCSQHHQSLSDLLYSKTNRSNLLFWLMIKKRAEIPSTTSGHLQLHALITCNSGRCFARISETSPLWRHSFGNVARSWHLTVNSFTVRCRHVTMNLPMNGRTVAGKRQRYVNGYYCPRTVEVWFQGAQKAKDGSRED